MRLNHPVAITLMLLGTGATTDSIALVCALVAIILALVAGWFTLEDHILRLVRETVGQDLIEYALLAALIGTIGVVAWTNTQIGVRDAYQGWGSGVNTLSTCVPDPIRNGGGGCSFTW